MRLVRRLGLGCEEDKTKGFCAPIPKAVLDKFNEPYPPKGYWSYGTDTIKNLWNHHLKYGKQAN